MAAPGPAAAPPGLRAVFSRAGLLTCGFYAAIFTAIGAHLPFWPVWLSTWGLSEAEVGAYMGAGLVLRIVANAVLGALADRFAIRRAMLSVLGVASAVVFVLHLAAETKAVLFLLTLLVTTTLSPMIPLGEALGLRAAGRHGFAYAHARAAGSVAFLLANMGVGWAIAETSPDAALWTLVAANLATAAFGLLHPGGGAPAGVHPGGGHPGGAHPSGTPALDQARLREGLALFRTPTLAWFAVAAALGQGAHATYYLYGSIDWARQGIDAATIGQLWAVGVVAETVLMLGPGAAWVARLGALRAMILGAGVGAIRWTAMVFDPGLEFLWPLQALHAFSFGLLHLATMAYAAQNIPPRLAASGQGVLLGLASGVSMALATLAAGWLTGIAGLWSAWAMCAAMGVGSALAALAAGRALSRNPGEGKGA
ncbi:MAG: MFS transporter [Pseudomonadota bacterium]